MTISTTVNLGKKFPLFSGKVLGRTENDLFNVPLVFNF